MFCKTKITHEASYLVNKSGGKKVNKKDSMLFLLDEYELTIWFLQGADYVNNSQDDSIHDYSLHIM